MTCVFPAFSPADKVNSVKIVHNYTDTLCCLLKQLIIAKLIFQANNHDQITQNND